MGLYCESSWGLGWGHLYVNLRGAKLRNVQLILLIDHSRRIVIGDYCYVLFDSVICFGVQEAGKAKTLAQTFCNQSRWFVANIKRMSHY